MADHRASLCQNTRRQYAAFDLGPLPVDLINSALGTELEPGLVHLSAAAHRHIAEDHPADYPVCFAWLEPAIAEPTFIGQAPGHASNFEILRRIRHPDGKGASSMPIEMAGFW